MLDSQTISAVVVSLLVGVFGGLLLARLFSRRHKRPSPTPESEPTGPQPLLVFVTDRTGRPESVQPLIDFLKTQVPFRHAHVLAPPFRIPWGWGNEDLSPISNDIAAIIKNYFEQHRNNISYIVLCGYSLGAMLASRAFLDASGLGDPPDQKQPWAAAVGRIVLVGAVCRGFRYARLGGIGWVYGSPVDSDYTSRSAAHSPASHGQATSA